MFTQSDSKLAKLMDTLESIYQQYSKGTIKLASEHKRKARVKKQDMKSPNFTGEWNELPNTTFNKA